VRHPTKFPINDQYTWGIAIVTAVSLYVVVSLLTCRTEFNLAKMLHRGKYAVDSNGKPAPRPEPPPRTFRDLLGIDEHFTPRDKIIATVLFCYVMSWFVVFLVISIWNIIHVWPDEWWSIYWFYAGVVVPIVLGTVTSIWFTFGTVADLRKLLQAIAGATARFAR